MSVTEMNAIVLKKTGWTAAWGMALGSALVLGGCVSAFEPKTDPTSPLAPRVQQLVDENRQYPRWADFPRSSSPLPAPAEVAANVGRLESRNAALTAETARIDWTLNTDPAAFVAQVNRRVDASQMSPQTLRTAEQIEAYAEELRQRAKAPPPIDRPRPQ
ncbi:hypothetical protein [Brevundimonas sp.]|uniref:hypothetical protein n=2 Tax=Brevundimonas sp. TaxID=1871086 RepID=UPI000E944C84|nr:hypothetical protein [Brevundimonas sp.]HBY44461.1 hypothetical protein [Brevundimonas sp.]